MDFMIPGQDGASIAPASTKSPLGVPSRVSVDETLRLTRPSGLLMGAPGIDWLGRVVRRWAVGYVIAKSRNANDNVDMGMRLAA